MPSDWGVFTGDGVAVMNPHDESRNEEHVRVKGEYISLNRPSARVSDADPVVVPNVPFKHLLSARGLNLGFTTRVLAPVSGSECSMLLQFSSLLCGGCEGNLLIFETVLPDQQQWGDNQLQEVSNGSCAITDFPAGVGVPGRDTTSSLPTRSRQTRSEFYFRSRESKSSFRGETSPVIGVPQPDSTCHVYPSSMTQSHVWLTFGCPLDGSQLPI